MIKNNIPNCITISRYFLSAVFPVLLYMQVTSSSGKAYVMPVLILFACICITDFADGRIARKIGAVSTTGAILDVTADLTYIAAAFTVLNFSGVVPVWFTVLIFLNFIEFQVTSYIMKSCNSAIGSVFVFDCAGRAAAFMFYIIPGVTSILYGSLQSESSWIINLILVMTTVLALISFADRCLGCIRAVNSKKYSFRT